MKLAGVEARKYLDRPDPARPGLLLFGADPMRVALKRQKVITALVGAQAETEMRLARMSGGDLRRDPAALMDAVKAQGFFPGQRAVFVEEATDGLADVFRAALADWRSGDAVVVVTAGALAAKSALRKLFETHPAAYAMGIYDDPPRPEEVEAALVAVGLRDVERNAMIDLMSLGRELDPGDFRQTLEKIGLYKLGDATPVTSADIAACAPMTIEADVDDLIASVAEARSSEVVLLMRRLEGQGVAPVKICIDMLRHFRTLHYAASDPGGSAAGIARARPPIFGPRRDQMQRQAQQWGARRLETALELIVETDLALRSSSRAPGMAVVERMLIRLAMMLR